MAILQITAEDSVLAGSSPALAETNASGFDTLILDADAFLIGGGGASHAVHLDGQWTVRIAGEVAAPFQDGIFIEAAAGAAALSTIVVGKTGYVFGGNAGIGVATSLTLTNFGTIASDTYSLLVNGVANVDNAGLFIGDVRFLNNADSFTNFKKVGKVIKNGTVFGMVDLWGGNDLFRGGALSETVRDSGGSDTYNLGGGNDIFLAIHAAGASADATDVVNGGVGIDTYDATGAISNVTINLATGTASANGATDNLTGFENATGGSGTDDITGSNGANVLVGGGGTDTLRGGGGRDILTGNNADGSGSGTDFFQFQKLSDSGLTASTRDLITDFEAGIDKIVLTAIDANAKLASDQAFHLTALNGYGNFTKSAGELRFRWTDGGNTVIYGDVNGDGAADFSIALKGHIFVSSGDFFF